MRTQNQIKRKLSEAEAIEWVRGRLAEGELETRTALAREVCERLGFRDRRGKAQLAGCLKGLRELEGSGKFRLPAARIGKGGPKARRLGRAVEEAKEVPEAVGGVRGLRLVEVHSEQESRIWNELMIREHPQGERPLVGRQLRYLIGSDHGWLGALGFASAALQLSARDQWIGWDAGQRRAQLDRIVGLNRFLIRPGVKCRNLASRALSLAMKRVGGDCERRYGYRPWLVESFVDRARFSGTCYRAANWMRVGRTRGRGRQDRYSRHEETIKDIYVYVLEPGFRGRLGLAEGAGLGPLSPGQGMEAEQWAEQEFGGARLGDRRLSRRLVKVAHMQAQEPGRSFSGVSEADWPAVKAYYRLIDHPDEEAVTARRILEPHRERTLRRMQGQRTVLCIQDGSDLNYARRPQCEGLGMIGRNQTGVESRGLHLHSTLAVAPNGLPLGVLRAECSAAEKVSEQREAPEKVPIEHKKTFEWIAGLRDLTEVASRMPGTRLVNVCDREADFFEMFDEWRRRPAVDLLIRAQFDRKLSGEETKLFEAARQAPVGTKVRIQVPRSSARPKVRGGKARAKRLARRADLVIRTRRLQLHPPKYHADKAPVEVWVIHAREEDPPEGTKRIEWFLLTTWDLSSAEQAVRCLRWYGLRRRIEDWHRVLKTGCKIEQLGHHTAERLRRAIAIYLVIAWRILLMTLLGRESPELPAEVLFSDLEVRVLKAYAKKKRVRQPLLLGEAVRLVARIGGYLGRANDPPPGHQLMWQGYSQLHFLCEGFTLQNPADGT